VVIGPDDRARGEVQLKDLRSKSQRAVGLGEVVATLLGLVRGEGVRRQV